jgi:hypothetical protein
MAQTKKPVECRVCGCTEDRACEGGCSWVEPALCSDCVLFARFLFDKFEQTTMGSLGSPLRDPNTVNHRFTVGELVTILVDYAAARRAANAR